MISKTILWIDFIGQIFILSFMIIRMGFLPNAFIITILLTFLLLGTWQFCNGLIGAIFFKNKLRQKYLLAAIAYFVSLFIFRIISIKTHYNWSENVWLAGLFFGGCSAFGIWYFYETYQTLFNKARRHPRSFWDYEF